MYKRCWGGCCLVVGKKPRGSAQTALGRNKLQYPPLPENSIPGLYPSSLPPMEQDRPRTYFDISIGDKHVSLKLTLCRVPIHSWGRRWFCI